MRSRSLIVFFALFIPVLSVYFFSKAAGRVMMAEKTEIAMGTVVQIKAPIPRGVDRKSVERAIDEALKEIRRIESVFSVFRPDSEISKINRLGPGEKLKDRKSVV